ncbi:MAG: thiazole synthase, partial [Actinomycetota bacterium]
MAEPRPPRREKLQIADRVFQSRLIFGTGGFTSLDTMHAALKESCAQLATVAMRRIDAKAGGSILEVIRSAGCDVLPNTAGCYT